MRQVPSLASVMTPFPFSIDVSADLVEARAMMTEHDIRHLPVTEAHAPVGVVSDRDLRVAGAATEARLAVGDVCSRDLYVVDIGARLDAVVLEMADRHVGSALVLRAGKLVGIFTTTDACRVLGRLLSSASQPPPPIVA